jgi:hypothetical protein
MRNKLYPIVASCTLILAMLACNLPGGQNIAQPDLGATITAQALELQAASGTPAPADTPLPANTPLPSNPPPPADTPQPPTPAKPADFKANGSGTTIVFSWSDKSTNEDGFRIYQDGVTAPIISVGANTGTGGMSSNWTGQACGFKAKFYVRAFNNAGESPSSKSADGVTIPCQPGNLTENPGPGAISFNWSVQAQHNEDGFHIYQQGVSQPVASRGPNKGSGGTIFDLTGLPCNLVATYYVTAFNSAGESPATNLVQSESVPCGPSGVTITSVTKNAVTYSFTDNGTSETGFHVYADDVLYTTLPPHPGTGTINSDIAVQCDFNFTVNHVYSVRAFNYAGESPTSEHVGATIPQC